MTSRPLLRDTLADIALSIPSDALPPEVIHQAKRLVLDTIASAYGGLESEPSRIVQAMASDLGGRPEATIIGTGARTSRALATLVNGTMMRFLNANDYYFGRNGSHASGNLAAAMAVAEAEGRSGRDLLAGLAVAYEIQLRFCDHAGDPNIWDRGWHHATHVQFASAAASAWLMRLDSNATANALAVCGSLNNALAQLQRGTIPLMKATAEAQVAKAGVEAALLARHGLTGPEEFFEGRFGWIPTVAGTLDIEAMARPVDPTHYRIMDTCTKPYAAEFMTQAAIQAALDIRKSPGFRLDEITAIDARFHDYAFKKPSWDPKKLKPENRETADHSFTYCIAVALLEGACGPEQFRPELIASPEIAALMDKMTLSVDPRLTALWPKSAGAGLTLHLSSGRTIEETCFHQPGHPDNPESDATLEAKFRHLSAPVLSEDKASQLIEAIWSLEDCADLSDFTALLAVR